MKTKREYEGLLDDQIVNGYRVSINNTTPLTPKEAKLKKYNNLLNMKIEDEILKKDIISHAEQLLRHRITAIMVCRNNSSPTKVCSASLVGILPEDEEEIRQFFIGIVVMSNLDWQNKLNDFKEEMRAKNKLILNARPVISPDETILITNMTMTVQFK